MGMATLQRMSIAEFEALEADPWPYELIDGELIVNASPTNPHEGLQIELLFELKSIIGDRRDVALRGNQSALHFGPDTVLQPDIFIYACDPANRSPAWADVPIPLLVVEILSPSTAKRDRGIKRQYYQARGVEEYWIFDLKSRSVESWHPSDEHPEILTQKLAFRLSVGLAGQIDLAALFARA